MHKKLIILIFFCISAVTMTVFAQDTIAVDETIEGEAGQGTWQLFLEAGQVVQIDLSSETFDTILQLTDENGEILMSNDDVAFPSDTNSQIIFTPNTTGNYTLVIRGFGADLPPDLYTLSVVEMIITANLTGGELAFDTPMTVEPNGAAAINFDFEAQEGDVVNISVVSEFNEDTNLAIYDPEGNLIAEADDDRAGNNPSLFRFKLSQAGEYSLVVKGFNEAPLFSPLTVTLEQTEELLLNDSAQTIALGNSSNQDVMVLNTEAGQVYAVTVHISESTASSLFVDVQEQGEEFAGTRLSASGVDELSFAFTAAETGQARFILSFFSFDETDMEFTVEVVLPQESE